MPEHTPGDAGINRLLAAIPADVYARLEPHLQPASLTLGEVIYEANDALTHVYFPLDSVVSLLYKVDDSKTVEVAMEGNEGVVGLVFYMGGMKSYNLSVVRDSGTAMRLDIDMLAKYAAAPGPLRDLLNKSTHALITQIAQSGICNRFHSVDARLARWLLMTRDRIGSRTLLATQETIARILGVRRSSVTESASTFQQQKIIDYSRGRIDILDQRRLLKSSCTCYGIIKRQYDSFLR